MLKLKVHRHSVPSTETSISITAQRVEGATPAPVLGPSLGPAPSIGPSIGLGPAPGLGAALGPDHLITIDTPAGLSGERKSRNNLSYINLPEPHSASLLGLVLLPGLHVSKSRPPFPVAHIQGVVRDGRPPGGKTGNRLHHPE